MSFGLLVIEDEATLAKNIKRYMQRNGYDVKVAGTGEAGLAAMETFQPDIVLLDYQLPALNGLEVLARIRHIDERVLVILMTAHGNIDLAVEAMKLGAYDFLSKPITLAELRLVVDKAVGRERMAGALSYYQRREADAGGIQDIRGESAAMEKLKADMGQLLASEAHLRDAVPPAVLISGETGTGKELVARAIHFGGARHGQPFVEVNCAALPGQLVEAELFGHERGAFTDARERRLGLVEAANGGTLFLDEVGETEPAVQAKLLKVLEDRSVRRLGSVRERQVDVRIIAASNRNLEALVGEGKFRSDLYFRLRIIHLVAPPLRNRGADALLLARYFLAHLGQRYAKAGLSLSTEAEAAILAYAWPGNVRELRNVIEHAVLLATGNIIGVERLPLSSIAVTGADGMDPSRFASLPAAGLNLEDVERELVMQALERESWNITRAARLLGLTRDTLRYRMEKHALRKEAT